MTLLEQWKSRARRLKVDTYALYLAYREPEVPWYAKVVGACVVGYLLSPVDLIPDFSPVLGYLDDLVIVPLGITITVKMIPVTVMDRCRIKARESLENKPRSWVAAGLIVAVWLLLIAVSIAVVMRAVN
ncbi:MAG: DUF1232 domain-containing protein [Chloroflexi bacterium]|nr:DUF1232 domain-containing protein [Chloroflexota bacterium]